MCEPLVGLPDVVLLGIENFEGGQRVHIDEGRSTPWSCSACNARAWVKDHAAVELVDLPVFGRPAPLVQHKHRLCCPNRAVRSVGEARRA